MSSRNSLTFFGTKKLLPSEIVTLLLVIDSSPSDRSYSQFWRSSHIKILLLYEKFYLRHKKSKWLNFHNYSIKKTRKPTKVSGSFYWYFMMWKMLAGVWYERGNNIEDNAIGCHSLVSMIRLLTPSSPSQPPYAVDPPSLNPHLYPFLTLLTPILCTEIYCKGNTIGQFQLSLSPSWRRKEKFELIVSVTQYFDWTLNDLMLLLFRLKLLISISGAKWTLISSSNLAIPEFDILKSK